MKGLGIDGLRLQRLSPQGTVEDKINRIVLFERAFLVEVYVTSIGINTDVLSLYIALQNGKSN
jgi:hypothetical protein